MPRIPDGYLDASAYLYPSDDCAERGESAGGSGFLITKAIPGYPGYSLTIAVTNRHVIERGNPVIRMNRLGKGALAVVLDERYWRFHPDGQSDLAFYPFEHNIHEIGRISTIPQEALLSRELARDINIGIGDEVFLIGRFIGNDGKQTNVPTARFGSIAQMPSRDVQDEYGRVQESLLIDIRTIGGYSGSPVLVHVPPFSYRPEHHLGKGYTVTDKYLGPFLLGVEWAHTTYPEPVFDATGRAMQTFVRANTGLSEVIPAWKVAEMLNHPDFEAEIQEQVASLPPQS